MILAFWLTVGVGLLYLFTGPHLLFGWVLFPVENVPRMTYDLPTLTFAGIMLASFVILLRSTLRWWGVHRGWTDEVVARRAKLPCIIRIASLVLLLFVSGTSLVAIGHQTIWLMSGSRNTKPMPPLGLVETARFEARRSFDRHIVRNIGNAILNYSYTNDALTPSGTWTPDGRPLHGWITMLGGNLMINTSAVDFDRPWNEPPNDRLFRCGIPDVWMSNGLPRFDRDGYGLSHVALNGRLCPPAIQGFNKQVHPPRAELLKDGAANTILAGEAAGDFQPWGSPNNVRDPLLGLGTSSQAFGTATGDSATLFLMADGSVRAISNNVDPKVFESLGTPRHSTGKTKAVRNTNPR